MSESFQMIVLTSRHSPEDIGPIDNPVLSASLKLSCPTLRFSPSPWGSYCEAGEALHCQIALTILSIQGI